MVQIKSHGTTITHKSVNVLLEDKYPYNNKMFKLLWVYKKMWMYKKLKNKKYHCQNITKINDENCRKTLRGKQMTAHFPSLVQALQYKVVALN